VRRLFPGTSLRAAPAAPRRRPRRHSRWHRAVQPAADPLSLFTLARYLFVYHLRPDRSIVWRQSGDRRSDRLFARRILPVSERVERCSLSLWPALDAVLARSHPGSRALRRGAMVVSVGLQTCDADGPYREYGSDLADHAGLEAGATALRHAAVCLEPAGADRIPQ